FHEAVRKALSAYREMVKDGKAAIIDPRAAWETYEPATHPASEAPIQTPDAADVAKRFDEESKAYLRARFEYLSERLKKRIAKDETNPELANELGIVYIQHGKTEEAVKEFTRAAELDPRNAAALTNLGNLSYMEGKFDEALVHYQKAADEDPQEAGLWMNLTRAALKSGKAAEAGEFSKKALTLDPGLEPAVQSLLK
ncbi:MAG: tetratricopeptide repeat protein, partial [Elusimicrobiota bacterium]